MSPINGWRSLPERYSRYRYGVLFLTLLLTLIAAPIVSACGFKGDLIEILLFLSLAAAAFGADTPAQRNRLLAIILATGLLQFLGRWLQFGWASNAGAFLWVLLAVAAAVSALRYAMRGRNVDSEHLSAALSAYLLAGHLFGMTYWTIEGLRPGSFAIGGLAATPGQLDLQTAVYFSFVTLATLGYGDISPLTPTTRGIAICEAILGQLYLAVLVSRLVSGFRKPESNRGESENDS